MDVVQHTGAFVPAIHGRPPGILRGAIRYGGSAGNVRTEDAGHEPQGHTYRSWQFAPWCAAAVFAARLRRLSVRHRSRHGASTRIAAARGGEPVPSDFVVGNVAAAELLEDVIDDADELDMAPADIMTNDEGEAIEYTDFELLSDDLDWSTVQIFRQGADETGLLSFGGLCRIGEVADMLKAGDILEDELKELWDECPKKGGYGDVIDVTAFTELWQRIDDLFEDEEEKQQAVKNRVEAPEIPQEELAAVRKAVGTKSWKLQLRFEGFLRPPVKLHGGVRNPLCSLGECGQDGCSLSRLAGNGCREYFADLVVEEFRTMKQPEDGFTFLSFGGGGMYFEWQLLERLIHKEGLRIKQVWILEPFVNQVQTIFKAQIQFASWFKQYDIEVFAFVSADNMLGWIREDPSVGKADIIVNCDSKNTIPIFDDKEFARFAVKDGCTGFIFGQNFQSIPNVRKHKHMRPDGFKKIEHHEMVYDRFKEPKGWEIEALDP